MASASSNGSVHVWRVEYTSRSGGAPDRYTGIIGAPSARPSAAKALSRPNQFAGRKVQTEAM